MVQIVIARAANTRIPATAGAASAASARPRIDPLETMLGRIAGSTRLTLAEKRSFADAIKAAYEAGDYKLVARIMMLVSQLEMQRKENLSRPHTIAEITGESGGDSIRRLADTTRLLTGTARIRELLA